MLMVELRLSALSYSVLARLLNELRSFMRKPFSRGHHMSAAAGMLALTLAASLAGCASKNPLIDDEAAARTAPAPTASTSVEPGAAAAPTASVPAPSAAATATTSPAPQGLPAAPVATAAPGVQVTAPTGLRRFLGIFSPYRIDIQQGNFVSREMVAQLKEGMQNKAGVTREQVRFALGTPLLQDIFHADRWDYVFRLKKSNGEVISSRVTVYFKGDRLVRIEGGDLPTEKEYLALIAGSAPGASSQSDK